MESNKKRIKIWMLITNEKNTILTVEIMYQPGSQIIVCG